jgi:feruloyl esterase
MRHGSDRSAIAAVAVMGVLAGMVVAPQMVRAEQTVRTPAPAMTCETLAGLTVPADAIGAPTRGATIREAVSVPAAPERMSGPQVVLAIPGYCKVSGAIAPVDPGAPDINFQINLPLAWNQKLIQLGGSGLNGVIPVALTTNMQWGPESIPPDAPYALSRGFVTFGSDSGHQSGGRGGGRGGAANDWANNTEALTNFAWGQMKKTHDVAVHVVQAFYGRAPRHSYYMGSSQGGREALMVAQRFPADYDGIFVQVPVLLQTQWNLIDDVLRVQSQIGEGWLPREKVGVVGREVLRQCDAIDGLADGYVSNYIACNDRFDPARSPGALAAVRCEGGGDAGPECLSDAQIRSVNAIHARLEFGFPMANGWTGVPGWPTGGELPANWKLVNPAPTPETTVGGMLQSLVVRDPAARVAAFTLAAHRARLQELSALLDASNPDLSAFARRGGKLIYKVNSTDYTANPRWSYEYYRTVVERMGQPAVDRFMRFYVAIGIFHNRNLGQNPLTGERAPSYVDFIDMLDRWVETGTAPPDAPVLRSMDTAPPFAVHASRPMCRYPRYPRYRGTGDPNDAGSFTCAAP